MSGIELVKFESGCYGVRRGYEGEWEFFNPVSTDWERKHRYCETTLEKAKAVMYKLVEKDSIEGDMGEPVDMGPERSLR